MAPSLCEHSCYTHSLGECPHPLPRFLRDHVEAAKPQNHYRQGYFEIVHLKLCYYETYETIRCDYDTEYDLRI